MKILMCFLNICKDLVPHRSPQGDCSSCSLEPASLNAPFLLNYKRSEHPYSHGFLLLCNSLCQRPRELRCHWAFSHTW